MILKYSRVVATFLSKGIYLSGIICLSIKNPPYEKCYPKNPSAIEINSTTTLLVLQRYIRKDEKFNHVHNTDTLYNHSLCSNKFFALKKHF